MQAWEKAHIFALAIYKATSSFPKEEVYGLTSQMRRSSTSIPANIAEGCGRDTDAELARFLQIAMGSASEIEYQILLAHDLGCWGENEFTKLATDAQEIKRMPASFLKTLKADR